MGAFWLANPEADWGSWRNLRKAAKLTAAIWRRRRSDDVIPFRLERVTRDVERSHLGIADLLLVPQFL
jgi:hypothetical protein